jgi:hypothetical protein
VSYILTRHAARNGHVSYNKGQRKYQRKLYTETADTTPSGYTAGFTGVKRDRAISPDVDRSSAARIADVNFLLPSGWFGTFTTGEDVALEMGMYRAFHRWMADYCGSIPNGPAVSCWSVRATLQAAFRRCVAWHANAGPGACWSMRRTVRRPAVAQSDLGRGAGTGPVRGAAHIHRDAALCAGRMDTWDNLWLQRSAAHPWCGMRNMAAPIGSRLLDRFPRLGCLEAGCGWLPFWMARLDEHMETIRSALPPDLKYHPSEYVMGGRCYQMSEGERVTNMVADIVGDHVPMYASDHPHGESAFPQSTNIVLGWNSMTEECKRKLFWDNPRRSYARCGL